MFAPSRRRNVSVFSTFLANCVLHVAHATSIQTPFAVLLLGGAVLRCMSLPFTLYADSHFSRVARASPQLRLAWHNFDAVLRHPLVSSWEKKLAARKLLNERTRILHEHRTSTWQHSAFLLVGAAFSGYLVCVPGSQLGNFLAASQAAASSTSTNNLSSAIVSPLAVALLSTTTTTAGGGVMASSWSLLPLYSTSSSAAATLATSKVLCVVDPTLSLGIGLALYNVCQYLDSRMGFNAAMDHRFVKYKRRACVLYTSAAFLALVAPPLCTLVLPSITTTMTSFSYFGPLCLGMATMTWVKNRFGLQTALGRALLRIEERPASHGVYPNRDDPTDIDNLSPAQRYDKLSDALLGLDHESRQTEWRQHKRLLEYESDTRLNSILIRLGIFDELSEVTYEMDKTARKRSLMEARRLKDRNAFWSAQSAEAAEETKAKAQKPVKNGPVMDNGQGIWYQASDQLPPESQKELERIQRENAAMWRNAPPSSSSASPFPHGGVMAEDCNVPFSGYGDTH